MREASECGRLVGVGGLWVQKASVPERLREASGC